LEEYKKINWKSLRRYIGGVLEDCWRSLRNNLDAFIGGV